MPKSDYVLQMEPEIEPFEEAVEILMNGRPGIGSRVIFRVSDSGTSRLVSVESGHYPLTGCWSCSNAEMALLAAHGNALLLNCRTFESSWIPLNPALAVFEVPGRDWFLLHDFTRLAVVDGMGRCHHGADIAMDELAVTSVDKAQVKVSGMRNGKSFAQVVPWEQFISGTWG